MITASETTRTALTRSGKAQQVLLTSFKRNGQGVDTQIGIISEQGKIYFMTAADTWKVKRLTHNPQVMLTPCSPRGKAKGPAISGRARRLQGDEAKQARERLRTGILGHFWGFIFDKKNPGDKTATFEIVLDPQ